MFFIFQLVLIRKVLLDAETSVPFKSLVNMNSPPLNNTKKEYNSLKKNNYIPITNNYFSSNFQQKIALRINTAIKIFFIPIVL